MTGGRRPPQHALPRDPPLRPRLHGRAGACSPGYSRACCGALRTRAASAPVPIGAPMLKYWKDLRHLPRPVWVVAGSQLVNRAGSMVLSFLVLYLTRERGFSPEHAGFILFLYGAGSIVCAPLAGRLADRWGACPDDAGSLLLSGAMLLLYPLARSAGHRRGHDRAGDADGGVPAGGHVVLRRDGRAGAPQVRVRRLPAGDQPRHGDRTGDRRDPRDDLVPLPLPRRRRDRRIAAGLVLALACRSAAARRRNALPRQFDDDAPAPVDRRARRPALPLLSRGASCR